MKIRNGFVSNSSSSSFVIVGSHLDKTIDNCKSLAEKYFKLEESEILEYSNKKCCGKTLKSKFCPICGKNSDDVIGEIDWIGIFNDYYYDIKDLDINEDDGDIIIGKEINLDLESDCVDIDKFITELQEAKKIAEGLNIGVVKLYCGTTYN